MQSSTMSSTNCDSSDEHCSGDKNSHKHEGGNCIHPDGSSHPIHEKH